jgi:hypothetical protein
MLNPLEQVGTCDVHNKILCRDRKTARKHARRMKSRQGRMNAFECGNDHPGLWHLGHLPGSIVRGDVGREWINGVPLIS